MLICYAAQRKCWISQLFDQKHAGRQASIYFGEASKRRRGKQDGTRADD